MKKSIVLIFFMLIYISSCNYIADNNIKKSSYKGIIINIYDDQENHYLTTFKTKTSKNNLEVVASFYPNSAEYANVGDSIIKEEGEQSIIIIKKNGESKVFYFNE